MAKTKIATYVWASKVFLAELEDLTIARDETLSRMTSETKDEWQVE